MVVEGIYNHILLTATSYSARCLSKMAAFMYVVEAGGYDIAFVHDTIEV